MDAADITINVRRKLSVRRQARCLGRLAVGLVFVLTGCRSTPDTGSASAHAGGAPISAAQRVAELQIVDCLLPGQVRSLGNTSYLTPRRPVRTTAADCRIRGGEYVAYDRANYKTALAVWMASAERGDAKAQANVGEIFERGLGGTPNYAAAAIWYRKAAEQGNRRAEFNLGTLYEQGHGVPKNMVEALNWYRKAWGLPPQDLTYTSYADKRVKAVRAQLQQEIKKKDEQIRTLERQVRLLRKSAGHNHQLQAQITDLSGLIADLRKERNASADKSRQLRLRQPEATGNPPASPLVAQADAAPVSAGNINFGRYYALLIGDQDYQKMQSLRTPLNDIERIGAILKNKYGFSVTYIKDANNVSIMEAINNLSSILTKNDNLLIYYAGHGSEVKTGDFTTGYWLPVNADPPPRDTFWISSEFVTRHLAVLKAKRVLVVADSCYGGLLADAPGLLVLGSQHPSAAYIRYKLNRRSRLLLTSGGDKPVLDNGGGRHSIFAKAVIDVLSHNDRLLTGPEFFAQVRKEVVTTAKALHFHEEPQYRAIKDAGHEVGDFFLVPSAATAQANPAGHRGTIAGAPGPDTDRNG